MTGSGRLSQAPGGGWARGGGRGMGEGGGDGAQTEVRYPTQISTVDMLSS